MSQVQKQRNHLFINWLWNSNNMNSKNIQYFIDVQANHWLENISWNYHDLASTKIGKTNNNNNKRKDIFVLILMQVEIKCIDTHRTKSTVEDLIGWKRRGFLNNHNIGITRSFLYTDLVSAYFIVGIVLILLHNTRVAHATLYLSCSHTYTYNQIFYLRFD